MTTPRDIYAEIGDRLSRAILEGDFQLFRSVMALPLEVVPQEGESYTLETSPALEEDFNLYHQNIILHRVTDLYRENIQAEETAPGEITASFRMHLLAGANQLVPPFMQIHILKLTPDGWRIRQVISAIGHINWTLGRAHVTGGVFVDADQPDDET